MEKDKAANNFLMDCENVLLDAVSKLESLKNSVVVITGGTGFMGTWIAGLLAVLNDKYDFNIHMVLLARDFEEFKKTRPYLSNRRDVECIKKDVRQLIDFPKGTAWVIHAAGSPDNRKHASNPLEIMSVIADGTMAVVRAAERCSNLKMLLNISSALVYGQQPLDLDYMAEDYCGAFSCSTVASVYSEAKRYAEAICAAARSQNRIPIITARPFAFMGPYQSLDRPWAVNNFIYDIIHNDTIKVLGDGETIRSYLYGSDMALWLLVILTNGSSGDIYNVGSNEAVSLKELAQLIVMHANRPIEIKLKTSRSDIMQRTRLVPDVTSAMKNFGLKISVGLDETIKRTYEWNKVIYAKECK